MSEEMGLNLNEAEKEEFRILTHNLMRWGLRYNKALEEQTAQLHMLTGWSQIVEVHHLLVFFFYQSYST
jgi:nuclear pore complex protein Nup205